MRPQVRFLETELIERIVDEARTLLCQLGVEMESDDVVSMLSDNGAQVDGVRKQHGHPRRVRLTNQIIDKALASTPPSLALYDVFGQRTHDLTGSNVHFTPGSSAIYILDHDTKKTRTASTDDYVRYTKVVSQLDHLAAQSTALIPQDVHAQISDSYRLYLSLLHCEKPVVTGAFAIESFDVMRDLLLAVRGTRQELVAKPLAMFSCCATAPLKWSGVSSQTVVACAEHGIPVELISMPLSGFVAPVTMVGSLVQHTAEVLSGIVISQSAKPGAPLLYGGSPAIFDVRFETTPMGAVETMVQACAYSEIGKSLGIPTQAYIALSDSKLLDAQAGLETSMGATLAALAGINSVSGPGMLDFESCISLEKLILDHEVCQMAQRMIEGIEPREDFPSLPRFEELLADDHLLISKHTRKHLRREHHFPGPTIDRANRSRWEEEGGVTLGDRAHREVQRLVSDHVPSRLTDSVKAELTNRMVSEARSHEMSELPCGTT